MPRTYGGKRYLAPPRCSRCNAAMVRRDPPADDPGERWRGRDVLACRLYQCPHDCERYAGHHHRLATEARVVGDRAHVARVDAERLGTRELRRAGAAR